MDNEKKCFVIMPIADIEPYEEGHFTRVYEYLIKPACIKAGFTPVRADEVASSNYIVIDIMDKIYHSDLVLCDLSGKNPNVLYELGVRQAFNLPTVLIKDKQTNRIFDIQGMRTYDYDESLRADKVKKDVPSISSSIIETVENKGKDVNSLIKMLSIKPAEISNEVELSGDSSVILSAINDITSRLTKIESAVTVKGSALLSRFDRERQSWKDREVTLSALNGLRKGNWNGFKQNDHLQFYDSNGQLIKGTVTELNLDYLLLLTPNNTIINIDYDSPVYKKLEYQEPY
ncbi:hypothetical protein [Glaciecola sp. 1036]|uniref:hypothetical protein n=1 Tax=Alteromonadaceae TaxID=72275 RepID=UPI003D06DE55